MKTGLIGGFAAMLAGILMIGFQAMDNSALNASWNFILLGFILLFIGIWATIATMIVHEALRIQKSLEDIIAHLREKSLLRSKDS